MRMKCEIKIVNREVVVNGLHCGKAAQAVLFAARKPNSDVFLVYCTAKQKEGVKHEVRNNVLKIFSRFISSGKATIQLKNPPFDICISKALPAELKLLIDTLSVAHQGGVLTHSKILSSFAPAKSKHLKKVPTNLVITSKINYPVKAGFSSTLKSLTATNCSLARFDNRLFSLKSLSVLDLSSNKIKAIPKELSTMEQLSQLVLSKNEIKEFPRSLCSLDSKLCSNLKVLDLSENQLTFLPTQFCNLRALCCLQLNHNHIRILPRALGQLVNLRKICASNNLLKYLPGTLLNSKKFECLDFFSNPMNLQMHVAETENIRCCKVVEPLQVLAARVIKERQITYDSYNIVPYPIVHYLDNALRCYCGRYCFGDCATCTILRDMRSICDNTTGLDVSGNYLAVFQIALCSTKCRFDLLL